MGKFYKNDSHITGFLLIIFLGTPFVFLYKLEDVSIVEIIGYDLVLVALFYLLLMPGCWDVYLDKDKITFRNEWNFLWSNEWEFTLKEIVKVEIVSINKEGPGIRIITKDRRERFHSLGLVRTKELTNELRQKGISVESYLS